MHLIINFDIYGNIQPHADDATSFIIIGLLRRHTESSRNKRKITKIHCAMIKFHACISLPKKISKKLRNRYFFLCQWQMPKFPNSLPIMVASNCFYFILIFLIFFSFFGCCQVQSVHSMFTSHITYMYSCRQTKYSTLMQIFNVASKKKYKNN